MLKLPLQQLMLKLKKYFMSKAEPRLGVGIWLKTRQGHPLTRQLRYARRSRAHKFSSTQDNGGILTEQLIVLRIALLKRLPARKAREEV
jgi:hypothetical protein